MLTAHCWQAQVDHRAIGVFNTPEEAGKAAHYWRPALRLRSTHYLPLTAYYLLLTTYYILLSAYLSPRSKWLCRWHHIPTPCLFSLLKPYYFLMFAPYFPLSNDCSILTTSCCLCIAYYSLLTTLLLRLTGVTTHHPSLITYHPSLTTHCTPPAAHYHHRALTACQSLLKTRSPLTAHPRLLTTYHVLITRHRSHRLPHPASARDCSTPRLQRATETVKHTTGGHQQEGPPARETTRQMANQPEGPPARGPIS